MTVSSHGVGARARLTRTTLRVAAGALQLLAFLIVSASGAFALTPIVVQPDQERIEITTLGEAYEGRGDSLQVETAAGDDGVSGRMTVRASTPGANPNWMVFALTNKTDKPIERWLTADRYNIIGSGTVWPDLDARRIESVTPSIGFVPERIKSDKADVFRITLEPGQTITYVAELSSERFARLYLWKPIDYEVKSRDRQLFNGAMLGLTGLLAIFLTAVFAANHKIIFPAAALVSWSVLTYLCVDFGFFHKLFNLRPEDNAVYRAAGEAAMAASFVIFLIDVPAARALARPGAHVDRRLDDRATRARSPSPSSIRAWRRRSRVCRSWASASSAALFTLFLAVRGQDRALSLIPTWVLFLVWMFATGMTLSGRLVGRRRRLEPRRRSRAGRHPAWASRSRSLRSARSIRSMRARRRSCSRARWRSRARVRSVWEWNIRRDEFKVGPEIESALALMPGELSAKVDDFVAHVHPDGPGTLPRDAVVRAGARGRAHPHRFPHAPRRQQLALVRTRSRERAERRRAHAALRRPDARHYECQARP